MTDYTADRYDWSKVDTEAIYGDSFARCIIELRARIEALEAAPVATNFRAVLARWGLPQYQPIPDEQS
jgi:hypothetical protein